MRPIFLDTDYDDYLVNKDVIVFKEDGNIVYEFPIPKGYKLILISDIYSGRHTFIFSEKKLEPPKYIPKGYKNLTMSDLGLYVVEGEKSKFPVKNKKGEDTYITTIERKLYYMDTSIISPEDMMFACKNLYKISEEDIPQNFWFSLDYRDLYNDFACADVGKSYGWYEGSKNDYVSNYIQKFDSNFRIINEYELLTLLAFNKFGQYLDLLFDNDLWEKYCTFNEDIKVHISGSYIELDNWWKVASSMENSNIYLQIYAERIDLYNHKFERICNNHPDDEIKNRFIIPVIDEETVKSKVLGYSNN